VEPKIAVAVAMGALHGLHAAHEAKSEHGERLGIIHRDVSPQNILIGDDGVPRVVDFGVAKAAGRMQRTDAGHVKGKPRYMAPEQLEGDEFPIDHRVDVFSMGTVLWEALTGKPLFNHATFMGVLAQVVKMEIPAPHEVEPSISRALSRVVHRALSRDLSKRWATALEFAVALEEAAASEGLIATQHTLGAWVRERAAPILAERQTIIESIERRTLSLRDPPRISDPDEDAEPSASSPSFPLPPPLENRAPEPAPTPRPRVDRPSDVLASMKTIKMPPKAAASEDDEPDRPTLEQDRPTLPTRIHPVRTTDLMPPEPGEAGAPVGLDEPAEPAFARIQVPAQAEQAAAFSKLMETPSDTPPPTVAAPPRRVPWLLVAAILLAIAVVLVMLLFSELGRS
jgi:serine/threonine-protein kinase